MALCDVANVDGRIPDRAAMYGRAGGNGCGGCSIPALMSHVIERIADEQMCIAWLCRDEIALIVELVIVAPDQMPRVYTNV